MKKTFTISILCAFTLVAFSQAPENWEGNVMTVNGLVPADSMGITLPHEHLLIVHKGDSRDLTDEATAITELQYFVNAGGKTLTEMTNIGIGRNPEGLKRISVATGVNVIMGSGFYKDKWIPDSIKNKSVEQLTNIIISDILDGINGIHAGVIGEIGISRPTTQFEEKVLIAAAHAQKATGAAINLHFDAWGETNERHHALDILENEGADLTRVYISHNVPYLNQVDNFIAYAQRGCYVSFDLFGLEVTGSFNPPPQPVETIKALINKGYLKYILISQDVCFSACYVKNGGFGYAHILNNIIPQFKAGGITDEQIDSIMVENPKRLLPFKIYPDAGQCENTTYTTPSGTVTDNSGTSNYLNNMTCSKLIQPANCGSVTLTFDTFNTEVENDVLSVYDGATTSSPLLGQFSGNTIPPVLTSTGGNMLIVFTTNGTITESGWNASYSGTLDPNYNGPCVNETFRAESGTFSDNSGSANYYNNMSCLKLIQPPGVVNITLTFNSFATESGYDFVRVYDGATTASPLLGQFSGTSLPAAVSSTGGSMLVLFTTDKDVVAAGWSATYTGHTTTIGNCVNENFTAMTGTVTDNSGSANYHNNMSCQKLIQPSGAVNVTLNFNSFATESGYDFVKVYDGATTSSPLLGQFSGTSLPAAVSSTGGSLLIVFITDNDVVAEGWSATYTGNGPFLNVTPGSMLIGSASGTTTFTVTSNIDWSIIENSSWLTATKTNNTTLTVTFDENTSFDPRSAEITAFGGDVPSQNIVIDQSGVIPVLSVTPESKLIGSASGTTTFTVTSNIDWSVNESSGWLTAIKTDNTTLTVTFDENTSFDSRSEEITASGEDVPSQNIIITQSGVIPVLIVTPGSNLIGSAPGTITFTVTSNIDWSVNESSDWLTATKTDNTTLTIRYDENTSIDSRLSDITVGGARVPSQNIIVNQNGVIPVLSVTPDSNLIGSASGTITFTVTSNIDWSVNESSDWLTATKTDNTTLTVTYDENTSIDSRISDITVGGAGIPSQNITVNQSGVIPVLSVTPESNLAGSSSGTITFTVTSNIDWSVNESSDWLTATKTDNTTLTVSYDENTSINSRLSEITVGGTRVPSQNITVTQSGVSPVLIVTPGSRSVSSASGTTTFTITSNIDWSVSESSSWLTASKTDITTLTVSYDENTSLDPRSAEITTSGAGVYSQAVSIIQEGALPNTIIHISEIQEIIVFPNPVSNKTWLTYPKGTAELIEIYEFSGRLIISLQDPDQNGKTEIDFSGLNSGIYIYRLIDKEGNVFNGKILKE